VLAESRLLPGSPPADFLDRRPDVRFGASLASWLATTPPLGTVKDHGLPVSQPHDLDSGASVMSDNPRNEPSDSADDAQRALQAVQFALDRRDNGGDAGATRD
jgi:hypothetical protein